MKQKIKKKKKNYKKKNLVRTNSVSAFHCLAKIKVRKEVTLAR